MGSHAFAPPSPYQGEGRKEGASRWRLFPLTQTLSPSGARETKEAALSCRH